MGNFKHQSLRAADRDDRDRDSSERLRNVRTRVPLVLCCVIHLLSSCPTSMTGIGLPFPRLDFVVRIATLLQIYLVESGPAQHLPSPLVELKPAMLRKRKQGK